MATVYNLEPQPTAKVLLQTTSGDILLELFASQTPLTSRNFLQHCLDGYYTGTIFHRLIPNFIIQGGDPTGTGSGGESSFDHGVPFADELHSRLKFNRRGLLGMANGGGKDDNGSQFFLTLGKADELTGKHTMFGRVEGNTIYNLVKMGEADLAEEGERPLFPTRVTGAEVLVNPFEGMVKRVRTAATKVVTQQKGELKRKVGKKKGGKSLLSFGGGEEEEEDGGVKLEVKKFNPKMANTLPEDSPAPSTKRPPPPASAAPDRAPKRRAISRSPSPEPIAAQSAPPPAPPAIWQPSQARSRSASTISSRSPSPPTTNTRTTALLDQTNAQIAALKASLKRTVATTSQADAKPKSALEAMIPATAMRGRKRKAGAGTSKEEQRALNEFKAFGRKLEQAPKREEIDERGGEASAPTAAQPTATPAVTGDADDDEEAALCDLHFIAHCQSCAQWANDTNNNPDNDDGADDDTDWLGHTLTFAKDRLGKDLKWKEQNEKELVVIDPREREREIGIRGGKGGGGRGGKGGERGTGKGMTEWDRRGERGAGAAGAGGAKGRS